MGWKVSFRSYMPAEPQPPGRVTRRAGAEAEDGGAVDAPGQRRLLRDGFGDGCCCTGNTQANVF